MEARRRKGERVVAPVILLFAHLIAFEVGPSAVPTESLMSIISTDTSPTSATVTVPFFLEYIAVMAGAISGALVAVDRDLDIVGVIVMSLVVGLGGGMLRDILMPTDHVYILEVPSSVILCVMIAILAFYFRDILDQLTSVPMFAFDILTVGLFSFVGAEKGLMADYGVVASIMLGTLTGVGGGVIRDLLLNEIPQIFQQGNFYAIAGFAGSFTYVALVELHIVKLVAAIFCVVVTMGLRVLSVRLIWRTTAPVDLSRHVVKPIKHILRYPDGTVEVTKSEDSPNIEDLLNDTTEDTPLGSYQQVTIIEDIEGTGQFQAQPGNDHRE